MQTDDPLIEEIVIAAQWLLDAYERERDPFASKHIAAFDLEQKLKQWRERRRQ